MAIPTVILRSHMFLSILFSIMLVPLALEKTRLSGTRGKTTTFTAAYGCASNENRLIWTEMEMPLESLI